MSGTLPTPQSHPAIFPGVVSWALGRPELRPPYPEEIIVPARPKILVFDVNETLSDMAPMAGRFEEVGATAADARLWFTALLRDGFALTAAGGWESFTEVGRVALHPVLAGRTLNRTHEAAADHIIAGVAELPLHPDVAPGLRRLHAVGYPLVTLTNGSVATSSALLTRAGVAELFTRMLSVNEPRVWKPGRAAYYYAAEVCEVAPADMMLVAVHPWDIDGAARAGLSTAWINRGTADYPGYLAPPTEIAAGMGELAALLESR